MAGDDKIHLAQELVGSNMSPAIGESMEARVKDPLWLLARQWQTGEFEAENGGHLTNVAIEWTEAPLDSLDVAGTTTPIDLDAPLDCQVEAEAEGSAPAWVAEALEYRFALTAGEHRLDAAEYSGFGLDWHHFEHTRGRRTERRGGSLVEGAYQVTPTRLPVRGAPQPRWWEIEDGDVNFDAPRDPEPNVLSTLLPELFLTDINNWYLVPLPLRAGTLRHVTSLKVVDSFGVVTALPAAVQGDGEWRLFVLSESGGEATLDGSWLFVPNIAAEILHNDEVEDVRFIRDEAANVVWACERLVGGDTGSPIVNGEDRSHPPAAQHPAAAAQAQPRFHLASIPPRHWIPYVPRFKAATAAVNGETYLRRGRTLPDATAANPQYRGRIVAEAWRLNEEEVPRSGIRVRRIFRYAPGSDGALHFWIGRHKDASPRIARPLLKFDYLD